MTRTRTTAALAWLGAALLALGAWLALPREHAAGAPPARVVLLDVSTSALGADTRPLAALAQRRLDVLRAEARARGEDLLGVAFGRGARRFDPAVPLSLQFAAPEDASDLAAAFELVARLASERRVTAVELVADGTWTGADPAPSAARLAAQGVVIGPRALASLASEDDVGIAPFGGPLRVRAGAPVAFEVEAWHARGTASMATERARTLIVAAELVEPGARTRREVRAPLASLGPAHGLQPVRIAFEFPPLQAAWADLEVRTTLEVGGAAVAEGPTGNDVARARVETEGRTFVEVLGSGASRDALAALLAPLAPDLVLSLAPEPAAPSMPRDAGLFLSIEQAFPVATAEALDRLVLAGSGWVDLAGARFAGGARPRTSALTPADDGRGPRAVIVLLDASGSMSGEPARAARGALAALVEEAPPDDPLEARWLLEGAALRVDLGGAGERADPVRRALLRQRAASGPEPRGPTRIWGALEDLARELDGARRTLAVLVSDGRDPDRVDLAARATALRAALAARDARLVVVAAGEDPDRELLGALAGSSSEVLEAGVLGSAEPLARIFEAALGRGSVRVFEPPSAAAFAGGEGPLARAFAGLVPPVLRCAVRARAAAGAEVVWAAGDGAPVLALARRGLGVAAAFALPPAAEWVEAAHDLPAAIVAALRLAAPPDPRTAPVLFEEHGELVLEGPLEDQPAVVRIELEDQRGAALGSVDLVAARSGRDPWRERSAPLPAVLARLDPEALVLARYVHDGAPRSAVLRVPRAPEFARLPGRFVPPHPAAGARPAAPAPHPAAPWVALAGLGALAAAAVAGFFSGSRG
ncbi:MAG: hypothetical protein JNK02_11560 [Planctomycetes bacterium]|nr:hypothetical protein [Planctomycetota bacterium]